MIKHKDKYEQDTEWAKLAFGNQANDRHYQWTATRDKCVS